MNIKKKKFSIFNFQFLIIMLMFGGLSAQTQMPNSNFEQWSSTGDGNAIPKYWHSFAEGDCQLKGIYSWGCTPMKKNHSNRVQGHSGYGCEIYSKSMAGHLVNGVITTGQMLFATPDNNSTENYNYTDKDNKIGHNAAMKFTGKPDSVYFWCKFDMKKPSMVAMAKFHLHGNVSYKDISVHNSKSAQKGKIGNAFCEIKDKNDNKWHQFKFKFTYFDEQNNVVSSTTRTPSYILASFSTNKVTEGGSNGDKLIIDDIQMIYNKRLSYININGESLQYFNPDVLEYDVYCNINDEIVIDVETQSPHANAVVENPSINNNFTAKIVVVHDDGEQIYNIKFRDNSELFVKNSNLK